jgi:hypothetical protein
MWSILSKLTFCNVGVYAFINTYGAAELNLTAREMSIRHEMENNCAMSEWPTDTQAVRWRSLYLESLLLRLYNIQDYFLLPSIFSHAGYHY